MASVRNSQQRKATLVTFGMNGADVLGVVKDPSSIFGGFKLANVTDLHGTVTQDRLVGVRGTKDIMPKLTAVEVHMRNTDLGKARDGETDVVRDLNLGPFFIGLPDIAAFGLLSEEDVAFDRIGEGSVALKWVVSGFAPDGTWFRYGRGDKFYSPYDATFESMSIVPRLR